MDCSPPGSSVHGILQARILEWVAIPFSRDLPNREIEPKFPALQANSLPSEPPGKSKNTGGGNLSLLQWIFPTQELNQGLLHCRQILYQLSYQGSPLINNSLLVNFVESQKFYEGYQLCRAATIILSLFKDQPYILGELGGNEEWFPGLFSLWWKHFINFTLG